MSHHTWVSHDGKTLTTHMMITLNRSKTENGVTRQYSAQKPGRFRNTEMIWSSYYDWIDIFIFLVSWEGKRFDSLLPDYWVYDILYITLIPLQVFEKIRLIKFQTMCIIRKWIRRTFLITWKWIEMTFKDLMTISIRDFVVDQVKDCQLICSLKIPTLIKILFFPTNGGHDTYNCSGNYT